MEAKLFQKINVNNLLSSIVFLFVLTSLFVINVNQSNAVKADEKHLRLLNFRWPTSDYDVEEMIPKRDYKLINLTGNEELDCIKLNEAQLLIKDLVNSKDRNKGLKFHISDTTKFWTFIEVINICFTEKSKTFIPYKNTVWVLNY